LSQGHQFETKDPHLHIFVLVISRCDHSMFLLTVKNGYRFYLKHITRSELRKISSSAFNGLNLAYDQHVSFPCGWLLWCVL